MFKCNTCGLEFVDEQHPKGANVRCPKCHSLGKSICVQSSYVCSDCGLTCDKRDARCPACGGVVVKNPSAMKKSDVRTSSAEVKATDSGKKKIAEILGGYTYFILIGIWFVALYPMLVFATGADLQFLYAVPMLIRAVFASHLLSLYYTDSVKLLKWMYYYCLLTAVFGIVLFLCSVSQTDGGGSIPGEVFAWLALAFVFRKYKVL